MGANVFFRRAACTAAWLFAAGGTTIAAQGVGSDDAGTVAIAASSKDNDGTQCELHVWPSNGLRSVYHGWLHGGIVDGAVTGREGYPEVPPDPLTTARQVGLLEAAGIDALLKRPDDLLIIHSAPLASTMIRQSQTRLIASPSPCYSELIIEDVFFQEDIVNGGSLKSLIRYRDFGASDGPPRQFGTWTRTALKIFPPQEPRSNEAAIAELGEAFRANLAAFAMAREGGANRRRQK